MTPTLLSILTFLAAGTAVVGVYSILSDLYLRDRTRVSQRVDDEFRKRLRNRAQKSLLFKDLRELSTFGSTDSEEETSLRRTFEAMVEQSGLELTSSRLLVIVLATALTLGVLGGLVRRDPLVAVVGAVIGTVGPIWYVKIARQAPEKILSQLPDSFDLMSRVIRAGQTIAQAFRRLPTSLHRRSPANLPFASSSRISGFRPRPPCVSSRGARASWSSRSLCSRFWFSSRPAATWPRCSTI